METIEKYVNTRVQVEIAPHIEKIEELMRNYQKCRGNQQKVLDENERLQDEASKSPDLLAENDRLKKEVES